MTPYPAYKPTGLPWLPQIPEHWDCIPLGRLARLKSLCGYVDRQLLSVYLDKGVVRFTDIKEKRTNTTSQDLSKYQLVELGDFVLNNQQAWRGSVGVSMLNGIVSPAYFVATLSKKLQPHYANYLFRSPAMVAHYCTSSKGIGSIQRNLDWQMLKPHLVPVPPPDEQVQIVRYLNSMTAKINKLIRAKKQQIALLQEQKKAIINQAVTKGLDPNAEMKDSGIDWLGQIPRHWKIKRLGHLSYMQNGISAPAEYFGSGFPFMAYGDVYNNYEIPQHLTGLAMSSIEEQARYSVQEGDVFFTRTSETIEEIALAATCTKTIPHATFSGFLIRVRPNKSIIIPLFSKYYFRCILLRNYFVKGMNSVIRASLSQQLLRNLPVLLPPAVEQEMIAQHLEQCNKHFHEAIKKIENEIVLYTEYKNNLVSSIVTGQVDIRNISVDDFDPADLVFDAEDTLNGEAEITEGFEE